MDRINGFKGYFSLVKAIVTRTVAPARLAQSRKVQVFIPAYHGGTSPDASLIGDGEDLGEYPWAQTVGGLSDDVTIGAVVYLAFEGGDIRSPICVGRIGNNAIVDISTGIVVSTSIDGESYINASYYGGGGSSYGAYDFSSSSNTSYSTTGLIEVMREIIYGHESGGNYGAINCNDNGAISIGAIQWHGNNARNLLIEIRNANPGEFNKICRTYSVPELETLLNTSWSNFIVTRDDNMYQAIQAILISDIGKQVQEQSVTSFLNNYIGRAKEQGITDPAAIIFAADVYNQWGYQIDFSNAANKSLNGLYEYYCSNYSSYQSRRTAVKNEVEELILSGGFSSVITTPVAGSAGSGSSAGAPVSSFVVSGMQLLWPVPGYYKITSKFGYRSSGWHSGIDIGNGGNPTRPIHSAINGVVTVETPNDSGYGNYLKVAAGSVVTLYAHMSEISVKSGDIVAAGTYLGKMGSTGHSTGPHLHFELRANNSYQSCTDPVPHFVDVNTTAENTIVYS